MNMSSEAILLWTRAAICQKNETAVNISILILNHFRLKTKLSTSLEVYVSSRLGYLATLTQTQHQ